MNESTSTIPQEPYFVACLGQQEMAVERRKTLATATATDHRPQTIKAPPF